MSDALIVGIPSKGRLQENANAFFARAGMAVKQAGGGREYAGRLAGVDGVAVAFLSASEIASRLEDGSIHFGVTGEDLIREQLADPDNAVELVLPLGFGYADVVVAVPQSWIDVSCMADLDDVALAFHRKHGRRLRVATKYLNLTRDFFARAGLTDYRIVESAGATEGAPAAGTAEAIVDITTTGTTLAANNLKILDDGVILKSQANLVASLRADWDETALGAASRILDVIQSRRNAEERVVLRIVWFPTPDDEVIARVTSELQLLDFKWDTDTTAQGHRRAFPEYAGQCPTRNVQNVVSILRSAGAVRVTATKADYIFEMSIPFFEKLAARLGR